jgi:hypothetical protein
MQGGTGFGPVARQIRIDRRLPEGEVVRVTLHDRGGRVLFEDDVRQLHVRAGC